MSKSNVVEFSGRAEFSDPLTELLRQGARELIQQAVETKLAEYLQGFKKHRLEIGCAAVVRNGHHAERKIQTGIGPVTVKVPKVRWKEVRLRFDPHWYRRMFAKRDHWKPRCLALLEGLLHRRDGAGVGCAGRPRGQRALSQHGGAAEGPMGR